MTTEQTLQVVGIMAWFWRKVEGAALAGEDFPPWLKALIYEVEARLDSEVMGK